MNLVGDRTRMGVKKRNGGGRVDFVAVGARKRVRPGLRDCPNPELRDFNVRRTGPKRDATTEGSKGAAGNPRQQSCQAHGAKECWRECQLSGIGFNYRCWPRAEIPSRRR